ncbi:small heat shock protein [Plasmodium brasilianum]|uniref:Heat shock protein n=2 Tax=Plasmodium (Plasmodium) TaxID=418103 RepID=A0A1A8WDC5_PLAMA|nr:small heat shock protein, putative [Plasmodium malariae]KAI4834618.1 small heat shock protein [Plasmodium brasilianum]SBS90035.1 heat shock protein [Plasmodium malariae]SCP03158.1 small heat shock protein, putative [Plasmodium malariae]
MVMSDVKKENSRKEEDRVVESSGLFDNFFESMYEQMHRIDEYQKDMSRMMNSLRGHYLNNDFSKYFPSRRSLLDYDFRNNRSTDLFLSKPKYLFREGHRSIPPMDIIDKEKEIEIKMDVPGLNKDNVQINLYNGQLEISGGCKKTEEQKDEQHRYYVKERSESSFYRSFALPENVCEDDIKATFKDGVLKIDIPKKDVIPEKKKKIEIE